MDVQFENSDFLLIDKVIKVQSFLTKCNKRKQVSFSLHSKAIEFLDLKVTIMDTKGSKI